MSALNLVYKNAIKATFTTTGQGTLTLAGASAGFRPFSDVGSGVQVAYTATDNAGNREWGIGTLTGSQLSRDQVRGNSIGDTSKIPWGNGTKDIWLDVHVEDLFLLGRVNLLQNDTHLLGNKLGVDVDQDSYLISAADDSLRLVLSGLASMDWGVGFGQATSHASGLGAGPDFVLYRDNPSPADAGLLGRYRFRGRNSSPADTDFAAMLARQDVVTAGSEYGALVFQVKKNGTDTSVLILSGGWVSTTGNAGLLVGKTNDDNGVSAGMESSPIGVTRMTAPGTTVLYLNRLTNDGRLMAFQRNGADVGDITVAGGILTYNTFCGGHMSRWADDCEPASEPPIGTLLEMTDQMAWLDDEQELPAVRVSPGTYGAKTVYGAYAGLREDGLLGTWGIGVSRVRTVGPVELGELLVASDQEGCAVQWREATPPWPNQIVGRVSRTDNRDFARTVPFIAQCG